MKVAFLLAYTFAAFCTQRTMSAAIKAPLSIISLDDLTESERKHLEYLDSQYYPRPKRSGGDLISLLKETIGHGIKSKIGSIAKGSASAISHFSGGSSGHGHSYHHYDIPESYDSKTFDFWSLKKSILNTLLQAVKAIKGGVIAVKGQLIKGGGHLIAAKGKLISAKGEAISSLGKHIASSAILSPFHGHSASGHDDYGHSEPSAEYGAPSAPGPEYHIPEHIHSPHHHQHHFEEPHGGIIILKKIPAHGHHDHSSYKHEEPKVPDFKPVEASGPSFSTIVGKFFSASSSLKPEEPALFGHTATGYSSHDHPSSHSESHHYHDSSHSLHHEHSHSDHYSHDHSSANQASLHDILSQLANNDHHKPPSTSYGTPFEEAPAYLNFDEHTSASKKRPLTIHPQNISSVNIMPTSIYPTVETKTPLTTVPNYNDIIKPSAPSNYATNNVIIDSSLIDNSKDNSNLFIDMNAQINPHNLPNIESFPPYPGSLPADFIAKHGLQNINPTATSFHNFQNGNKEFLPTPLSGSYVAPTASGLSAYTSYSPNSVNYNSLIDNVPAPTHQIPSKRPTHVRPKHVTKQKRHPNFDVVRSIAFELGPNGPKRL